LKNYDLVCGRPVRAAVLLSICAMLVLKAAAGFAHDAQLSGRLGADEAAQIATDAYIYGYPLVTVEMTRRVLTNVAEPRGMRAPMGQFANAREYPTAEFKGVTAPNADTLYSQIWLDLTNGPYVISIPNAKGRYYLMPMLDGWTTVFAVPGKRTTGTKAQRYLVAGPGWSGKFPPGMFQYRSPTNLVWIITRTYCSGTPQDYLAVHAFQDQLSAVPLSAWGKRSVPPPGKVDPNVHMKPPVRDQVNTLEGAAYFKLLAELMKSNPPTVVDAPMVAKMEKIGLVPGQDFDSRKLDPTIAKAIDAAPKAGQAVIAAALIKAGRVANGWIIPLKTGIYGTDYLDRATITWYGLGANRPQDAVYPTSEKDADGKAYSGANKYLVHFDKRNPLPPVKGFWSLTMYDQQYFFVDNPLNRYTLSERDKLKRNADGSTDLYIQNESPGADKETNWLPAPKGRFVLMFRLYWPRETPPSILDGTWNPPPVKLTE
jgi:hypothetical protein